jgi:hypothetical protein
VQNRNLRIVPIAGGAVRNVATLDMISAALSWASNDEILFESIAPDNGIHRVGTNGGTPQLVVPLDTAGGETAAPAACYGTRASSPMKHDARGARTTLRCTAIDAAACSSGSPASIAGADR